ncbi:hypothetical protein D5086_033355 [Populus alba]|uniref:Uncharacterized protein n=1 Tax=Populus alba TaxID=43335 RepID=A0ACC4AGK0_POPAL
MKKQLIGKRDDTLFHAVSVNLMLVLVKELIMYHDNGFASLKAKQEKGANVAVGCDRKGPSQGIVLDVVPSGPSRGGLEQSLPTRSQLGASTDSPIKSFQHAWCSSNSVSAPSHVNFNGGLRA